MEKKSYKYCIVPMCRNTSVTAPDKHFFFVPKNKKMRQKWCRVMGREERGNLRLSHKTSLSCCEDHFDVSFVYNH